MKKQLLSLCVIIGITGNASATGIPVVDVVGNAQELAHWVEKVEQWKQTVLHYQDQVNAYKDQLATATGLRDIQGLIAQGKGLKNDIASLAKQGLSLNDLLLSGNPPSGELDSLYSKYKAFDVCNEGQSQSYATVCKQETVNKAWAVEQSAEVQSKISDALDDISTLSDRIASSKDSKESQDLANAIQAKSVQLNMLSNQWEMNMKASEQRDKLFAQKRKVAKQDAQIGASVADLN